MNLSRALFSFRPKRLHPSYNHEVTRTWQSLPTTISKKSLIFPIFITDAQNAKIQIKALPEQYQWGIDRLPELLDPLVEKGLTSLLLFGLVNPEKKNPLGLNASSPTSPVVQALQRLKKRYPSVLLITDVCMCQYTDHGHCGVLDPTSKRIDNSKSLDRISQIALEYAVAGADMIAPSDMMDGRVGAIKNLLYEKGLSHVPVMSYSAKYASCLYGPFREAAVSAPAFGDRKSYQLPSASYELGRRAIERDLEEGADFIMIKPAGMYLDIIRLAKEISHVPIACYQVSGEYSMLWHAAAAGTFGLKAAVLESLIGMRRAGADVLVSYYVPLLLDWLSEDQA